MIVDFLPLAFALLSSSSDTALSRFPSFSHISPTPVKWTILSDYSRIISSNLHTDELNMIVTRHQKTIDKCNCARDRKRTCFRRIWGIASEAYQRASANESNTNLVWIFITCSQWDEILHVLKRCKWKFHLCTEQEAITYVLGVWILKTA